MRTSPPHAGLTSEELNEAIQAFGSNADNDVKNFYKIIIAMNWDELQLNPGDNPPMEQLTNYIRKQLLVNQSKGAKKIATFLMNKGNKLSHRVLLQHITSNVFPQIVSILSSQNKPVTPVTASKTPRPGSSSSSPPPGRPRMSENSVSQDTVVDRINRFVKQLADRALSRSDQDSPVAQRSFLVSMDQIERLMTIFYNMFNSANIPEQQLTQNKMIEYLTKVIVLLLPPSSPPLSPLSQSSVDSALSGCSPPPQIQPANIASDILDTYDYFQGESFDEDGSFDEDDIECVFQYIMCPNPGITLKDTIIRDRQHRHQLFDGGSSSHHTKRPHRNTRCKKTKIKSRRKNKYNTTKTRKK